MSTCLTFCFICLYACFLFLQCHDDLTRICLIPTQWVSSTHDTMQLIGWEHAWRPSDAGIQIWPSKPTRYKVSNHFCTNLEPYMCCRDPSRSKNPRYPAVKSPWKATVVEHTPLHFPLSVHTHTHISPTHPSIHPDKDHLCSPRCAPCLLRWAETAR